MTSPSLLQMALLHGWPLRLRRTGRDGRPGLHSPQSSVSSMRRSGINRLSQLQTLMFINNCKASAGLFLKNSTVWQWKHGLLLTDFKHFRIMQWSWNEISDCFTFHLHFSFVFILICLFQICVWQMDVKNVETSSYMRSFTFLLIIQHVYTVTNLTFHWSL